MSRVAKKPVIIPDNVSFTCNDQLMVVTNGNNKLMQPLHPSVAIVQSDEGVSFKPTDDSANASWAMAGTTRALLANMVKGVTDGFTIALQLVGVGYRAKLQGKQVTFTLGKSHPDVFSLPAAVEVADLSSAVSGWQVTTGNEGIGTPCCETLEGYNCLPVALPTADTIYLYWNDGGYTGTIPTEWGLLTNVVTVR